MTPDQFFAKFALLADTPNAVAKMRELILDLALSGRLCDGEIASLQHKRIPLEKVASFINGDRGKNYPSAVHRTTDGVPFVNAGHLKNGDICTEDMDYISEERFELLGGGKFQLGDVIYCLRGSLGKCAVVRHLPRGAIASSLLIMRPHDDVLAEFLYYFLVSPSGIRMIKKYDNGSAQPNLSATNVKKFLLSLPPLAEQKRIVAKVDELMALCDQLESQQKQRETKKATLVQAALTRFTDAPTPANLELLFHKSYAIDPAELRKTILTLAVQGKLVPQDFTEEDSRVMIARALQLREKAIQEKQLRRKQVDQEIELLRASNLPANWHVESLANLVDPENTISYGVLVPGNDVSNGVPFVRAQDLCVKDHPIRPNKAIASEIESPFARTRLVGGEILLCVVGSIGKIGTVPPSWAGANIARAVARIKPIAEIHRDYLVFVLQESSIQTYFTSATRTLAQPTLNVSLIERTPIPVPPLAEQKRIVAKVEELMALVDKLEVQLAASRDAGAKLIEAVVAELARAA